MAVTTPLFGWSLPNPALPGEVLAFVYTSLAAPGTELETIFFPIPPQTIVTTHAIKHR